MRRLKCGFDLDGFTNNLIQKVVIAYDAVYHQKLDYNKIDKYDISSFLVPECKNIWKEFCTEKFMLNLDVEPTAVPAISKIATTHDVYFVTAGHPNTMAARDQWLAKHFPFYKTKMLIACANKQLLDLDLLGDDFEQNLIGGAYVGVLMDTPYNRSFDEKRYGITRINKVSDVLDVVARLERS
jgi:5'(3')-deoxyribonucleotidase